VENFSFFVSASLFSVYAMNKRSFWIFVLFIFLIEITVLREKSGKFKKWVSLKSGK